jgi:hypothetical protein
MDILESNEQILNSLTNPMLGTIDRFNDNNNLGFTNIRNHHSSFYGNEHLFIMNINFYVMAGFYYIGPFDKVIKVHGVVEYCIIGRKVIIFQKNTVNIFQNVNIIH